ncbi:hypothetical protein AKJ09_03954 [Labilithrix luteola]|uniref:Uncharacterized protein n=1 Tax=Labilithrix luteola TaxID=1391654 RepID=A0A0K1PUT5_9BACT|nr:hypothetical protein AKJ09_03954 [Labilithrix luteola]
MPLPSKRTKCLPSWARPAGTSFTDPSATSVLQVALGYHVKLAVPQSLVPLASRGRARPQSASEAPPCSMPSWQEST